MQTTLMRGDYIPRHVLRYEYVVVRDSENLQYSQINTQMVLFCSSSAGELMKSANETLSCNFDATATRALAKAEK